MTVHPNTQQYLNPTFQIGLLSCFIQTPSRSRLPSPQLSTPPGFSALCTLSSSHLKPASRSPTPPDSKSTNKFSQTHLLVCTEQICPFLIPQPTSFFLPCYSLCVSFSSLSLSAFSLILSLPILAPKMLPSLWALCHLHSFSYYLLSRYTGSMLILCLPQTPNSYFQ